MFLPRSSAALFEDRLNGDFLYLDWLLGDTLPGDRLAVRLLMVTGVPMWYSWVSESILMLQ